METKSVTVRTECGVMVLAGQLVSVSVCTVFYFAAYSAAHVTAVKRSIAHYVAVVTTDSH